MNDKDETSEEGYNGYVNGERDSGSKRREWRSGHTKVICVIWCVKNPFWHLVFEDVGLRVRGIWGRSEM